MLKLVNSIYVLKFDPNELSIKIQLARYDFSVVDICLNETKNVLGN